MRTSLELIWRGLRDPALYVLLLEGFLGYFVPYWFQRELLARMSPERRARSWNGLTWACAILWTLHPALSMIPFAWVTRPRRGVKQGFIAIAWGLLLSAICIGLDVGLGWLIDTAAGV
jgi:hypothetical protein